MIRVGVWKVLSTPETPKLLSHRPGYLHTTLGSTEQKSHPWPIVGASALVLGKASKLGPWPDWCARAHRLHGVATLQRRAILQLADTSLPVKPTTVMEQEASPTPLFPFEPNQLHTRRAADNSLGSHKASRSYLWSLWEGERSSEGAQGRIFHAHFHHQWPSRCPTTHQSHFHLFTCCSLCLEYSFPDLHTICASASCRPLCQCSLRGLPFQLSDPHSGHSPSPCPISFFFKGLISTWKWNNCCSGLTGYLQRTVW